MENRGTPFTQFDLAMMPTTNNTLVCDNDIVISDNFNLAFDKEQAANFVNHRHPFKLNFTMLLFCIKGHMKININLDQHEVCSNDMVIVLPGTIGESYEVSNDCQIVLVAFTAPMGNEVGNMSYVSFFRKNTLLHLSEEEIKEMLTIYQLMRQKLEQPKYQYTRGALLSLIQVMFCNALNHIQSQPHPQSVNAQVDNRTQLLFERFIELVQENYTREREIQYYAGLMCMTPKYLSRVVYQASGRYAGEWIRDYVILEAKALLKSGKYNVQQVSIRLNFASSSFFGKYFKKAVGCSPRKYAAS